MEDGTLRFDPSNTLKRAEFVQMLYSKEDKPAVTYTDLFSVDVPEGKWFTDAVLWAAENKIVSGKGNGRFDVNGKITRQEIVLMLYKYAQFKGYDVTNDGDLSGFADSSSVASWGQEAMKWAIANKLITGMNGKIKPNESASRAQAATIIKAFMVAYEGAE